MISLFLSIGTTYSARDVDKASLFLDSVNMLIFVVDGFLFYRVWWRESDQPTVSKKCANVYMCANLCNMASSLAYFSFIVWSLNARFELGREEAKHVAAGELDWYDRELIDVTFKQRTMYFMADAVYLVYALLLELGWYSESRTDGIELRSVQLKEPI
jgi:hypothetical protein